MVSVGVHQLQKNLLLFLQRVQKGESIAITSHGHAIAQLAPLEHNMEQACKALEEIRKTAIIGNIISPIDEEWEVLQ